MLRILGAVYKCISNLCHYLPMCILHAHEIIIIIIIIIINVNIVLLGNKACHTNVRAGCKYTSSKKVNETRYKKHSL